MSQDISILPPEETSEEIDIYFQNQLTLAGDRYKNDHELLKKIFESLEPKGAMDSIYCFRITQMIYASGIINKVFMDNAELQDMDKTSYRRFIDCSHASVRMQNALDIAMKSRQKYKESINGRTGKTS